LFYQSARMNRTGIWAAAFRPGAGWSPERPVTSGRTSDTHPAAAVRLDGTLWLFWSAYDAVRERWAVRFRTRPDGADFGPVASLEDALGLPAGSRRYPTVTVDPDGRLWLFWMERAGTRWALRYARFDGAWAGPVDFP